MPTAKRSRQLEEAVIGLDLGGTKLASALFDVQGQPLVKRSLPLNARQGHAVGELIVSQVRRLLQTAAQRKLAVCAIGACVPGIVRAASGRVWAPNIPGWDDYPLKAEIKAAVSDQGVKIAIESDRSASILGEAWQGAARDCRNAIFLAVGTGIGAGILVDGRVLHGRRELRARSVGWRSIGRFARSTLSVGALKRTLRATELRTWRTKRWRGGRILVVRWLSEQLTAHEVFTAYEAGDEIAKEVLLRAVEFWGMASANLISLFNPEKLIFGGGVFGPATQFLSAIAAEAGRWAQPIAFEQVEFAASQLEGEAALYGAAYLALRSCATA